MSFSLLGKIASEHVATLQKEAAPMAQRRPAPRRPAQSDIPFEMDGGILDDPQYKRDMAKRHATQGTTPWPPPRAAPAKAPPAKPYGR